MNQNAIAQLTTELESLARRIDGIEVNQFMPSQPAWAESETRIHETKRRVVALLDRWSQQLVNGGTHTEPEDHNLRAAVTRVVQAICAKLSYNQSACETVIRRLKAGVADGRIAADEVRRVLAESW